MYEFEFNSKHRIPMFKQIANCIIRDIERGAIYEDFQLPSINKVSRHYAISRDTIERAYKELKSQRYITSAAGKGFYISNKKNRRLKVLLVVETLGSLMKGFYDSFHASLGNSFVDVQIHQLDPVLLSEIIDTTIGKYDFYVIVPHFLNNVNEKDMRSIFKKIPNNKLMLVNKNIPALGIGHMSVFQNFENSLYRCLELTKYDLEKYTNLKILFPERSNVSSEIMEGAKPFCAENNKVVEAVFNLTAERIDTGTAYIVTTETDLFHLIKKVRDSHLQIGKDVGIISFEETYLNELLDITVITTDFQAMGRTAADLILNNRYVQVECPVKIIKRSSV